MLYREKKAEEKAPSEESGSSIKSTKVCETKIDELSKTSAGRGELLLDHNLWVPRGIFSFPATPIESPPDWSMDPYNNRSWVFLYHQLAFCPDLTAYDATHGNHRGLDLILSIVRDWWLHFSSAADSPKFAWHDHGAALRAINLLDVKEKTPKEQSGDHMLLDDILESHAEFLIEEKNYTKGTNHGLDQSISLFRLSTELPNRKFSSVGGAISLERIRDEIEKSFAKDGGHRENSTGYHQFGIQQLLKVRRALNTSPSKLPRYLKEVNNTIEKATEAFIHLIGPDGGLPQIGDTSERPLLNLFLKENPPKYYKQYLYAISAGTQGEAPERKFMVLPESGWISIRNQWGSKNAVHLLSHCGYNSHYHRHDDDQSFTIKAHGDDWVIDGGLYKYQEKDKYRRYLRSCKAHSITMPVNQKALRNSEICGRCTKIENHWSHEGLSYVLCSSKMFHGFLSYRSFTFDARQPDMPVKIRVSDCVYPLSQQSTAQCALSIMDKGHSYTSRFLIPGDKYVELDHNNSCALIHSKTKTMTIQALTPIAGLAAIKGKKGPEPDGWRSRSFGTLEPATVIEFQTGEISANVVFQITWKTFSETSDLRSC